MKKLNIKQIKLISGGHSEDILIPLGVAVGMVSILVALCAYTNGMENAHNTLKDEKKRYSTNHIKYLDSNLDAELAALNHYNKYGAKSIETLTNEQYGRPSAPIFEC